MTCNIRSRSDVTDDSMKCGLDGTHDMEPSRQFERSMPIRWFVIMEFSCMRSHNVRLALTITLIVDPYYVKIFFSEVIHTLVRFSKRLKFYTYFQYDGKTTIFFKA